MSRGWSRCLGQMWISIRQGKGRHVDRLWLPWLPILRCSCIFCDSFFINVISLRPNIEVIYWDRRDDDVAVAYLKTRVSEVLKSFVLVFCSFFDMIQSVKFNKY